MLAAIRTFTIIGIEPHEIRVEADVRRGLPSFAVVGLPDAAIREARERVRAAIANSGFEFPKQRITANLAPADLRKAGPGFDLALAAAVLAASGQLDWATLEGVAMAGELALDGTIRPVPGTLAIAQAAVEAGARAIVVAEASGPEAALAVTGLSGGRPSPNGRPPPPAGATRIVPVRELNQLHRLGEGEAPPMPEPLMIGRGASGSAPPGRELPDLADLRGQPYLRRALELAAAGGHSLLVTGPPGAGKTMAALRLPSLLPPLDPGESGEVVRIASATGLPLEPALAAMRPFRAPHHTVSAAGLIGGGNPLRPGEVTLAHRGVLFLDELPEFRRDVLEALRQPVEAGRVLIARAGRVLELPCSFQLIAAANPCPCGRGELSPDCRCGPQTVRRYTTKLSGALADRIDILLSVGHPDRAALSGPPGESSARVRERVLAARELQRARLGEGRANASMTPAETRRFCRLEGDAETMLISVRDRAELTGRAHGRVLRVARTIADLAERDRVEADDVAEALSLRRREQRP